MLKRWHCDDVKRIHGLGQKTCLPNVLLWWFKLQSYIVKPSKMTVSARRANEICTKPKLYDSIGILLVTTNRTSCCLLGHRSRLTKKPDEGSQNRRDRRAIRASWAPVMSKTTTEDNVSESIEIHFCSEERQTLSLIIQSRAR